jgi:hypothetical protein
VAKPSGDGLDSDTPSDPTSIDPRLAAAQAEFIRGLPARLVALTAAVETRNLTRAREVLHQLVGAGGIHGFMPISREAARLLNLARTGALADQPHELQPLDDLVEQAMDTLTDDHGTAR